MTTETFNEDGEFTVPDRVDTISVDVRGENGEDGFIESGRSGTIGSPGAGGYVSGTLSVNSGETLYIRMGYGRGENPRNSFFMAAGYGGAAADIRQGGDSLSDRVVVAGGGGGAGCQERNRMADSGDAGHPEGEDGGIGEFEDVEPGEGGTQTSGGGTPLRVDERGGEGDFGEGGDGGRWFGRNTNFFTGGGGSGWYGGGAGSVDDSRCASGAGGGSNYVDGLESVSTNTASRFQAVSFGSDGQVQLEYFAIPFEPSNISIETVDGEIILSWDDPDSDITEIEIYRDTDSGVDTSETPLDTVDPEIEEYTDNADLQLGRTYYYRLVAINGTESSDDSDEVSIEVPIPPVENLAVETIDTDTLELTWGGVFDDADEYEILQLRTSDESEFTTVETVDNETTSYTVSDLLDGRDYEYRIDTIVDGEPQAESDTAAGKTDITPVENLVLEGTQTPGIEVRWESDLDNGEYRIGIAEAGSSDYAETTVDFETFETDRDDVDELTEYDVRIRPETVDVEGEWVESSIVTPLLRATDLAAEAIDETSVELSWAKNTDIEEGQLVIREQLVEENWWPEKEIGDAGIDSESFTDTTAQPDRTYRYRIRAFAQSAESDSDAVTVETPSLGVSTKRIPTVGWYAEIDLPNGRTYAPKIAADQAQWRPVINDLPQIRLPTTKSPVFDAIDLEGQPLRVWKDHQRLPIDEVRSVSKEPGRNIIEGIGGIELDRYVSDIEYAEEDAHIAAAETIEEETSYVANVDDPEANTTANVLMQSADSTTEFESAIDSPSYPFGSDVPIELDTGRLQPLQTAWFREAEDGNFSGSQQIDDEQRWSGGSAVRLTDGTDNATVSFRPDYDVPSGNVSATLIFANEDGNPQFDIQFDDGSGYETLDEIPADALVSRDDIFDLRTFNVNINDSLDAGQLCRLRLNVRGQGSESLYYDAAFISDDRFSYDETTEVNSGVFEDAYQSYPQAQTITFASVSSVEQVVSGSASIDISGIDGEQSIGLRNGTNDWIDEANTDAIETMFDESAQSIQMRVTLGRTDSGDGGSGSFGNVPHELTSIELRASLDDTPVLLDKSYSGDLLEILNEIAEAGDSIWEVRYDNDEDETTIEWTQPGQRSSDRVSALVTYDSRRTIDNSYQRVIANGRSRSVENDRFERPDFDLAVGLTEANIQPGSERVYDPDSDDEFTRNVDYRMLYQEGAIAILEGGEMELETEYAIDYDYKIRGTYTLPGVDDPRTKEIELPDSTTSREAEQLAAAIVKEVAEPLVEADVTVKDVDPTQPLVEAIDPEELPFEGPFRVRSTTTEPGRITQQLGSRREVSDVVQDLNRRLRAVARRV